jgi:hypothetical protein
VHRNCRAAAVLSSRLVCVCLGQTVHDLSWPLCMIEWSDRSQHTAARCVLGEMPCTAAGCRGIDPRTAAVCRQHAAGMACRYPLGPDRPRALTGRLGRLRLPPHDCEQPCLWCVTWCASCACRQLPPAQCTGAGGACAGGSRDGGVVVRQASAQPCFGRCTLSSS